MAKKLLENLLHNFVLQTHLRTGMDQSHIVRQNERVRLIFACMLHPSTSYRAGWSYVIHGWLDFIHLRHRAALSKPHCAYTQKLGTPIRSTLLYDFGQDEHLVFIVDLFGSGDDEDYKEEPHQPNCQTNFVMCYLLSV